mmetsp:Transcript_32665/g.50847  ORF Transcript_32665/g.50847 Transcript_32665/m.50847 type:complete len:390 (-) Transcript_32665:1383-2552(-)
MKFFKMGTGVPEPAYPQAADAKAKWKASLSDLQTLKKLLSKLSDRIDKEAEAWSALADHLGEMGGRGERSHQSILFALSEGQKSAASSLWQLHSLLEDELLPELTKELEAKHPDLDQANDAHKKSRKELGKARKEKHDDEDAHSQKIQTMGNAVAETGSNLAEVSNRLRNEKAATISQALYTVFRNHIAVSRGVVEGLEAVRPKMQRAANEMCLLETSVRGSIGEISAPFDVKHVAGGGGGSRLADTTNIDLTKQTVKSSLEQAFPTRKFDNKLQGGAPEGGDDNDSDDEPAARNLDMRAEPRPPRPAGPPPNAPVAHQAPVSPAPAQPAASPQHGDEAGAAPQRPPPGLPPPLPSRPDNLDNPPSEGSNVGLATLLEPNGSPRSSAWG